MSWSGVLIALAAEYISKGKEHSSCDMTLSHSRSNKCMVAFNMVLKSLQLYRTWTVGEETYLKAVWKSLLMMVYMIGLMMLDTYPSHTPMSIAT